MHDAGKTIPGMSPRKHAWGKVLLCSEYALLLEEKVIASGKQKVLPGLKNFKSWVKFSKGATRNLGEGVSSQVGW